MVGAGIGAAAYAGTCFGAFVHHYNLIYEWHQPNIIIITTLQDGTELAWSPRTAFPKPKGWITRKK